MSNDNTALRIIYEAINDSESVDRYIASKRALSLVSNCGDSEVKSHAVILEDCMRGKWTNRDLLLQSSRLIMRYLEVVLKDTTFTYEHNDGDITVINSNVYDLSVGPTRFYEIGSIDTDGEPGSTEYHLSVNLGFLRGLVLRLGSYSRHRISPHGLSQPIKAVCAHSI